MKDYIPEVRLAQPFRSSVKGVLLRCVDMAETPCDAKVMLTTMYESGLLTAPEAFAEILTRQLGAE